MKRLGFALERVLMIDDSPEKLQRNFGNHLRVRPFIGDPSDTELRDLLPFLKHLSQKSNFRIIEKRGWRSFAVSTHSSDQLP